MKHTVKILPVNTTPEDYIDYTAHRRSVAYATNSPEGEEAKHLCDLHGEGGPFHYFKIDVEWWIQMSCREVKAIIGGPADLAEDVHKKVCDWVEVEFPDFEVLPPPPLKGAAKQTNADLLKPKAPAPFTLEEGETLTVGDLDLLHGRTPTTGDIRRDRVTGELYLVSSACGSNMLQSRPNGWGWVPKVDLAGDDLCFTGKTYDEFMKITEDDKPRVGDVIRTPSGDFVITKIGDTTSKVEFGDTTSEVEWCGSGSTWHRDTASLQADLGRSNYTRVLRGAKPTVEDGTGTPTITDEKVNVSVSIKTSDGSPPQLRESVLQDMARSLAEEMKKKNPSIDVKSVQDQIIVTTQAELEGHIHPLAPTSMTLADGSIVPCTSIESAVPCTSIGSADE